MSGRGNENEVEEGEEVEEEGEVRRSSRCFGRRRDTTSRAATADWCRNDGSGSERRCGGPRRPTPSRPAPTGPAASAGYLSPSRAFRRQLRAGERLGYSWRAPAPRLASAKKSPEVQCAGYNVSSCAFSAPSFSILIFQEALSHPTVTRERVGMITISTGGRKRTLLTDVGQ